MRKIPFFLFFYLIALSTACSFLPNYDATHPSARFITETATPESIKSQPLLQPTNTSIPQIIADPNQTTEPIASNLKVNDDGLPLPKYTIHVEMDYDTYVLEVEQYLQFSNIYPDTIAEITLAVQPNRIPGVFNLVNIYVNGYSVEDYSLRGQRLTFRLFSPVHPGQSVKVHLVYTLKLPVVEKYSSKLDWPRFFGVNNRQVNLSDWYPMLLPYLPGIGWMLDEPLPYGEHLSYPLANFVIEFCFTRPETAPVIAASAPAQPIPCGLHYELERGRDFTIAMGRHMELLQTDVDGVTIYSYYYPGNEKAAQVVLDSTKKAYKLYSELFGPYQHKSLSVVQGDFNDGMEFEGLYYLSNSFYNTYDGSPNNLLVMISAHETSHQWWFGQVASDQSKNPWQDEALATYCEKIFYERYYSASMEWWWEYRIINYHSGKKIDGTTLSYGSFKPYTNAVYRKGAVFIDELRLLIGDQTFFIFLKDYVQQMNGLIAAPDDFFRILRQHTSVDLSDLIKKYFSNSYK